MPVDRSLRIVAWAATFGFFGILLTYPAAYFRPPAGTKRSKADLSRELVYLPNARYLRVLTLGYDNVVADILWFNTINYFGRHYLGDRLYPWLTHQCEIVTDLDPRAEHVYRFGGMILPWEGKRPDDGIRILEKGTRALPHSWTLPFWLGFTYFFFKEDFAQAAHYMKQAVEHPDAPAGIHWFVAAFYREQHGTGTALALIDAAIRETDRPEIMAALADRRKELRLAADLDTLNAALARYASEFGHPPASLAALVEAQLVPRIPDDPFGGRYEIDSTTGTIRSTSGRSPGRLHTSKSQKAMRQAIRNGSGPP